jgi:hypothetical protein
MIVLNTGVKKAKVFLLEDELYAGKALHVQL